MIFAIFVLGLVSQGFAFQCDEVFHHRACGEYDTATKNLKNVVQTLEGALAEGMSEIAGQTASFYSAILSQEQNFDGKVIRLNNNTVIKINGNMTVDDLKAMLKEFKRHMDFMRKFGIGGGMFGLEQLMKTVQELISRSLVPQHSSIGYNTPEEVKKQFENVKASIRKALEHTNAFVRAGVMLVVNRFHGHITDFIKLVDDTMARFGITSNHWNAVKTMVDKALNKLKEKVGGATINKTAEALNEVESSLYSLVDAVEAEEQQQDGLVAKRGIRDIWAKITAAANNLGDKIKAETKKILEEHKPKILAALKNSKEVIIKGLKDVFVKINNKVVEILVDGKTD